jgi:hypothetical protein
MRVSRIIVEAWVPAQKKPRAGGVIWSLACYGGAIVLLLIRSEGIRELHGALSFTAKGEVAFGAFFPRPNGPFSY